MNIQITTPGVYEPVVLQEYFNITRVFRSKYLVDEVPTRERLAYLSSDDGGVEIAFSMADEALHADPVFHV